MYHRHNFGKHAFMFENNILEYMVLNYLKDRPGRGYDIINSIKERFFGFFTPGTESVYNTLKMLADMGYVNTSEKDGEKTYAINEEGKEYYQKRHDAITKFTNRMKERWAWRGSPSGFKYHRCGI